MRILVTGASGFVGGHLLGLLRREQPQAKLHALVKSQASGAALASSTRVAVADLDAPDAVADALAEVRPDRIVHLAGQSSVHQSWLDPEGTLRTNVLGLLHLLEGVRKLELQPRVLVVGSADEYGPAAADELPLREDAPLRPNSPYAVSKVAQGYLALQYALAHGMAIVRTRTFPHTGPGRGELFAESSFARQLVEIEAGRREPVLEVGNLEAVRDFSDVRDVVRAYWALLEQGRPGEVYNVCSGRGVRMRDLLQRLIELAGVGVDVRLDPERLRPSDNPALVGDPTRLRQATGWEPRYDLDRTLRDLLAHWREKAAATR